MKVNGLSFTLAGALLVAGASTMMADDWDHLTKVTFSESVEVPGKVLPAGTYYFRLLDSPSDRNVVEILGRNQKTLEVIVLAVPDQRINHIGKDVVQFSERAAGSPPAIKAWFYGGDNSGQRFVYPYDEAVKLAKANNEPVYSAREDLNVYREGHKSHEIKHVHVKAVQSNGNESELQGEEK